MKKLKRTLVALMLILAMAICFAGCNDDAEATKPETTESANDSAIAAEGLWKNAKYRKDTEIGEGSKTVKVKIEADGQKITIILKTNATTLGKALYDAKIINDASFFDTCNGIKADWSADKAYWAFYVGDDYASVGVNETEISGGEQYRLVYTK